MRDGTFLAVLAEREEQAIEARSELEADAVWEDGEGSIPAEELIDHLQSQPAQSFLIKDFRFS